MTATSRSSWRPGTAAAAILVLALAAVPLGAQQQQRPPNPRQVLMREAVGLDVEGRHAESRALFQRLINSATTARDTAAARRAMARSFGFDRNCGEAMRYELMVIDYWKTRETEEPQNAFYQQGEMANEGARICIDAGALDSAEKYYRLGSELGLREPEPKTHPKSLWDFRLAHASARIAARRGDADEALRQMTLARHALATDTAMAGPQERFFPYLVGYVALYVGDLATAEARFKESLGMRGNDGDPFVHVLLGMTYERQGRAAQAREMYARAYELSDGHNPPASYSRPFAREKLGMTPRAP
ncbi:MAG: hypothetical protein WD801_11010 [Gemmatimonadaceae bacterium]